jgi:two-component system OmpR family response regulator
MNLLGYSYDAWAGSTGGEERLRVLIIEDDREAAQFLVKGLTESGYVVDHADDGPKGLMLATSRTYDVLVVDRMLPGLEGLSVIETLRKNDIQTPALVLSAKATVPDRVAGLRAGADDYLTKPFAFAELLARLEALGRRGQLSTEETVLKVADLEMDLVTHKVVRGDQPIELQPREFRVLEYLMRNAGRVVTRTMLLEAVWDYNFDPQTNVIDVHISRLRQKIDKGFEKPLLHTVRGAGYRLTENA